MKSNLTGVCCIFCLRTFQRPLHRTSVFEGTVLKTMGDQCFLAALRASGGSRAPVPACTR